jgi:hypothetical protein
VPKDAEFFNFYEFKEWFTIKPTQRTLTYTSKFSTSKFVLFTTKLHFRHQRAPEGTRGITNFEVENFEVKGRVKGAITDHGSLEGRGGLLSVFRVLAADEGGPRFFFFYDRSFFMASAFFQAVLLDDDREVRRHSFSAFLVVDSADLQLSFPQGTGNNA